jgi:hypothetical protein
MKSLSRNLVSRDSKKSPKQPARRELRRLRRVIPELELLESRTLLAATLLNSVINPTLPQSESALNDSSVSQVFNPNGTPLGPNDPIVAGDIVVGVLRINDAITPPTTTFQNTQQLAFLFSAQILTQTTVTSTKRVFGS